MTQSVRIRLMTGIFFTIFLPGAVAVTLVYFRLATRGADDSAFVRWILILFGGFSLWVAFLAYAFTRHILLRFSHPLATDVLSTVSHDLMNPLTAIILGSAFLRKKLDHAGPGLDPVLSSQIRVIEGAARRMEGLLSGLRTARLPVER